VRARKNKNITKNDPPQPHHGLDKKITTEEDSSHSCPHSQRSGAHACWGAPRSSWRTLTPRCPPTRQKRRGRGFGRGGGRGGGRLGNLPASTGAHRRRRRRRRRRLRRCRVDGSVVDACVEGCLFVPGGELNEIKNRKKNVFALWPPTGNSNTTTNQKHTHATQAVNVRRSDL
jgi:hypothetical protein